MRHRKQGRKFSRTAAHRKAMFKNMSTSLLLHGRIKTTEAKAKDLRRVVEKLVTLGKKGTPTSRRMAQKRIRNGEVLSKLFTLYADRYADRPGGYTRVIKLSKRRAGDGAPMAIIEMIPAPEE